MNWASCLPGTLPCLGGIRQAGAERFALPGAFYLSTIEGQNVAHNPVSINSINYTKRSASRKPSSGRKTSIFRCYNSNVVVVVRSKGMHRMIKSLIPILVSISTPALAIDLAI
jgi:hypothetical protein